ncbi:MAG TPA: MFS transporter [Candidatus Acidoferrales bacterium]
MAMEAQAVTIGDLIDRHPLSGFQIWTIALCGIVLTLDGFDSLTVNFLATSIAHSTGIPVHSFGPIFSASLFGLMIAALTTGPIADRWGRKWPVILATLSFALFSLLTPRATTYREFLILRFLTGLGLGGAMPNVVALASEYSPKRLISVVVTILFCGMPLGGAICGLLSAEMIRTWGWHWVFYIGGVIPLAIAILLISMLPESVQFLAVRGKDPAKMRRTLEKVAPEFASSGGEIYVPKDEQGRKGVPVKYLFTEGRALGTILLWFPYFINLLLIYFISGWLPALLTEAGMTAFASVIATAFFDLGGLIACAGQGFLMNRIGAARVLIFEYALAAVFVGALGVLPRHVVLVAFLAFASGVVVIGAQAGLNALAARFYPTSVRSTGVGWALGVGRFGSIVGPLVGGMLLGIGWSSRGLLLAAAGFALSAWLAIVLSNTVREHVTPYSRSLEVEAGGS